MTTGILTTAWMCLLVSQAPNNVVEYRNDRNLRIPVTIQEAHRSEIREMILYASTDLGRTWFQAASTTAEKGAFFFFASSDGPHWLRVAVVSKQGKQDPDDKTILSPTAPVDQKIVIDTVQPIIRLIQAQRHGDDIHVQWDIQEEHPDRDGMLLEYQAKDASAIDWTVIPVPFSLKGETTFRPKTSQPITVRLTVRDLAGNQSYALGKADGTVTTAAFTNPNAPANAGNDKAIMGGNPQDLQTLPVAPLSIPSAPINPPKPIPPLPQEREPFPPQHKTLSPPSTTDSFQQGAPGARVIATLPPKEIAPPMPPAKVIADSQWENKPTVVPNPPPVPPAPTLTPSTKPVANSEPVRKPLPELIHVNNHQVTLEYALKRVGPSGIGGVELWLTKDDGKNWKQFAVAAEKQVEEAIGLQKRTFDFREKDQPFPDGIIGLHLVVRNRAGIGRVPEPGDVPEIRIEFDTQAPIAVLYQPIPDPQNPDQVLLKWSAKDKNLPTNPIHLEYADKREGPWLPIKLDLENKGRYAHNEITGDFSWKVPTGVPVQVFLRLRVRDKAGNESIAVTREAQYVDLTVPVGSLITARPINQK